MSEKKAVAKKDAKKANFFTKVGNWFVNLFKGIVNAFKNMWRELRKVTWPSREKLISYSTIVVLFIVFMMVVIGLLDTGASALVRLIMTTFNA